MNYTIKVKTTRDTLIFKQEYLCGSIFYIEAEPSRNTYHSTVYDEEGFNIGAIRGYWSSFKDLFK